MAHGINAVKNGHYGKEYWGRRPYSGWSRGGDTKTMTCRKERRSLHKRDLLLRTYDFFDNRLAEDIRWDEEEKVSAEWMVEEYNREMAEEYRWERDEIRRREYEEGYEDDWHCY